jgi:hypothetical protein
VPRSSHPLDVTDNRRSGEHGQSPRGLTNSQIAARLKIADRTADAHVEHIHNKLGLRSRSQIAVWAHGRQGKA